MAAQDEGQVPFSKLPLREIKDWLEDWMDLPNVNLLGGPGGGGGSSIINVDGGHQPSLPHYGDGEAIYVPDWGPLLYNNQAAIFNVGNQGWAVWNWTKFKTRAALSVADFRQFWQVSSSALGANNTVMTGIYNEDGTELLAETGFLHLNSDLGLTAAALTEWDLATIPFDAAVALTEGSTYILVQVYHASMTNGQFRSLLSVPYANAQSGLVQANGGVATDFEDQLTWGLSGLFVTNPDPTSLPDSLQAEAANISGSPNLGVEAPWGWLTE